MKETENEIIIEVPNLPPIKINKKNIEKIESTTPPDDVCKLIMNLYEKGVIVAGTTIDGKVSYYNIKPGEKCVKITLKDGRVFYVSS
ncbi:MULTISPECIES: hypothetical protein [Sulfolobaceae]|uniref:Uncharacterized protein n=2 Tax=Sulfurisphaera tokodaii TaxID=111955 RepID=F9VMH2_SULTO|nr:MULTISPECIES: hypothetical protein [Sulfolobaceae]QIW25214.1 hypothetical protein EWF20_14385 [Sulfolobus sp. S-194]BAK61784.1 hypothetical protein STK_24405 [Sulfurisphaera tokodaii str. 7]HII74549.1 hypothetical protein [Sulfurisphaera tokodaii]